MDNKFDTKPLFEKYGFKDFDNPAFYNVCKNNIKQHNKDYQRISQIFIC